MTTRNAAVSNLQSAMLLGISLTNTLFNRSTGIESIRPRSLLNKTVTIQIQTGRLAMMTMRNQHALLLIVALIALAVLQLSQLKLSSEVVVLTTKSIGSSEEVGTALFEYDSANVPHDAASVAWLLSFPNSVSTIH